MTRPPVLIALASALLACAQEPLPTEAGRSPDLATTTPLTFVQISVGGGHSCAVTSTNRAYCWGANFRGQLGVGSTVAQSFPRAVAGGHSFKFVSLSAFSSCGLTVDDKAWCWGSNSSGEIGDGGDADRLKPAAVSGGYTFRQLRNGGGVVCGVTFSDKTVCWGSNQYGQLGVDPLQLPFSRVPVVVPTGGVVFRQVLTGSGHTCALTAAKVAYCWGLNDNGQLGDGTSGNFRNSPTLVTGGLTFNQLSTGNGSTCGVTPLHVAYCWGVNTSGGLGDGTRDRRLVPTKVAGGHSFVAVAAGWFYTCGTDASDKAFCWGDNTYGQIGDGTFGPSNDRLVPKAVAGGLVWSRLNTNFDHTCGIIKAQRAYCWGDNGSGQIGDGTRTRRPKPTAVAGPS